MKLGRGAIFAAKLVLGVAAFAAAAYLLDWRELVAAVNRLNWHAYLLVFVIVLSEFPILAWRWHLVARRESRASAIRHIESYFVATFLGTFTPGHVGTDAYRFVSLKSEGLGTGVIVTLLLRERLLSLVGYLIFLGFLALLAWFTGPQLPSEGRRFLLWTAGAAAAGASAIVCSGLFIRSVKLLTARWLHSRLSDLLELVTKAFSMHGVGNASLLLSVTILSILPWTLAFFVVACLLDVEVSFPLIAAMVVIVELVRLIPLTVQGIGVRESAFAGLFLMMALDPATGFAISAICFITLNAAALVVGLIGYSLPYASGRRDVTLPAEGAKRGGRYRHTPD
jgi:uncharacterized membrane protein YbhN (UPF0104 family)